MNICRGNTFLVDLRTQNVEMIRRGAKKFFDLSREYIAKNMGEGLGYGGNKKPGEHEIIRNVIFEKAEQFLSQNSGYITIWNTNKANGENLQISYSRKLDAWVIASKNVAMPCRTKSDIGLYNSDRFHFSKLMAEAWFDFQDRMDPSMISDLKNDLDGKTMIGELYYLMK